MGSHVDTLIGAFKLRSHEIPASEPGRMSEPCRRALVSALAGRVAREGAHWRAEQGGLIRNETVRKLVADGCLLLVHARGRRTRVRLTLTGDWYARTIITQTLAEREASNA